MKSMTEYLDQYSISHQNRVNKIIHKFCVPTIFFTVLGMSESMHISMALVLVSLFFYYVTSTPKKFFALILLELLIFEFIILKFTHVFTFKVCLLIFIFSWIMQFVGHKIEGKSPSFLDDLLFLLVGPVWVFFDLFEMNKN